MIHSERLPKPAGLDWPRGPELEDARGRIDLTTGLRGPGPMPPDPGSAPPRFPLPIPQINRSSHPAAAGDDSSRKFRQRGDRGSNYSYAGSVEDAYAKEWRNYDSYGGRQGLDNEVQPIRAVG